VTDSGSSDNAMLFTLILIITIIPVVIGFIGGTFGETITGVPNEQLLIEFAEPLPTPLKIILSPFIEYASGLVIGIAVLPLWIVISLLGVWSVMFVYLMIKILKDVIPFT
jgi:hypothetical protein